jgi:hypothetical protein
MKSLKYYPLLFIISSIGLLGCNKAKDPNILELEYKIDPMTNTVIKITYNDANEKPVIITDWEQFKSGSRKIKITKKPFNAKLTVDFNNPGNTRITTNMLIYLNGEFKKLTKVDIPAQATITNTVEFLVE